MSFWRSTEIPDFAGLWSSSKLFRNCMMEQHAGINMNFPWPVTKLRRSPRGSLVCSGNFSSPFFPTRMTALRIEQKPNLITVLLHIGLKKITTNALKDKKGWPIRRGLPIYAIIGSTPPPSPAWKSPCLSQCINPFQTAYGSLSYHMECCIFSFLAHQC